MIDLGRWASSSRRQTAAVDALFDNPEVRAIITGHLKGGKRTPDIYLVHGDHFTGWMFRFVRSNSQGFSWEFRREDQIASGSLRIMQLRGQGDGGTVDMVCPRCGQKATSHALDRLLALGVVALDKDQDKDGRKFVRL